MFSIRPLVLVAAIQLHMITKEPVVSHILNARSVNIITEQMFAILALQTVLHVMTLLVHVVYVVLVLI